MLKRPSNWNLIDKSPVGIFYTDTRGDWSFINRRWSEICGLPAEGANNKTWVNSIHPEDRDRCQKEWRKAVKYCQPYRSEYRYLHEDGRVVWVLAQAFPKLTKNDQLHGFLGTLTDITEQKNKEKQLKKSQKSLKTHVEQSTVELTNAYKALGASEAKWASLVENVPDIVVTIDKDAKILFVNRAVKGLAIESVIGTDLLDYFEEEKEQSTIKQAIKTVFNEKKTTTTKTCYTDPKGEQLYFFCRLSPIQHGSKVIALTVVFTDITEKMRAKEAIRQHKQELSRMSQVNSMAELTSGLAHELNQPLATINNYANGCIRRLKAKSLSSPEEIKSIFQKIATQAERAGNIIMHLRSLARKEQLNPKPANINDVIKEAINYLEPELILPGIEIKLDLEKGLDRVFIDSIQIEQVIINIVKNAVEATKEVPRKKNPLIKIKTKSLKSGIVIRVIDQGVGLPEEVEHIFQPFVTTKKYGMGVGLTVCKTIIDAHGGELTAKSNKNKGATFSINLPYQQK